MKKLLFLALFAAILYSVSASAAAGVATINDIDFGTVSLGTTVKSSFTLTNDGDVNLTSVQFTFSKSNFVLSFNKTGFALETGKSENINFSITIPSVTSTGNTTLGSLNLVSTQLSKSPLFNIKANVVGGLIIEDLDVSLTTRIKRGSDGTLKSESASDLDVADGKKLDFGEEDVGPGSELKFNFNIENTFEESDDIDIEDVSVIVTVESLDDGDDIDQESTEFDIDSGKSSEVDIFINVPLSVLEGAYDIVVDVEGDDTNGNTHTAQMNLEMTVKREPREVIVSKYSLFPEKVLCGGTSSLTAAIRNLGARIEEDAGIEIKNSDLGLNYFQKNIELDEDPFDDNNEFTKILVVGTSKDTIKSGTYPITINAYLQEDSLWESRVVNLEVECASTGTTTPEVQAEEEPEQEAVQTADLGTAEDNKENESVSIPVIRPATTTEAPFTKSPIFWAIVLGNIALISSVAFFLVKAVKK